MERWNGILPRSIQEIYSTEVDSIITNATNSDLAELFSKTPKIRTSATPHKKCHNSKEKNKNQPSNTNYIRPSSSLQMAHLMELKYTINKHIWPLTKNMANTSIYQKKDN